MSPQIVVQVAGDPTRFRDYLTAQGVSVDSAAGQRLILSGDVNRLQHQVWYWARHCQVGLARVVPARNSLQHVFLNVVKEDPHASV
jgi:hypothetical protein